MIKHPRFFRGRFYNDEKDSVTSRLLHAAKIFAKSLPMHIFRQFRAGDMSSELNAWKSDLHCKVDNVDLEQGCSVTWIGHSTFLIRFKSFNILTDPVFFNVSRFFPRYTAAAIALDDIPKIDFVLVSHNHRDHLEVESLRRLYSRDNPKYLVPFGDEKLLKKLGLDNVFQKQWWDKHEFFGNNSSKIIFTFLPAVHWSGRGPFDINKSLWGSWMIEVDGSKIYFAGDSAAGEHFRFIGQNFPEIDLALMPIGPCQPREFMAESHLDAKEAIQAFLDLGAKRFVPMHWGTFKSGFESVFIPIKALENLWVPEDNLLKNKSLHVLKFGQTGFFDLK